MKSSWALEMFCIPYSFFFLVGFTEVLVGQKIESQTITKYIKTYHFMLSSQELSLILPLVPNWVNSRFGPILSKVDKILITLWTYLEFGNVLEHRKCILAINRSCHFWVWVLVSPQATRVLRIYKLYSTQVVWSEKLLKIIAINRECKGFML